MADDSVTMGQVLAAVEDLKGQVQLLAEGQVALGESLRSEIHGVRTELREFKDEMNAFRSEMYSFKDEMYSFRDETNRRFDEMQREAQEFRDETRENFKTLFEYSSNVVQGEEKNAKDIADHEARLSTVEKVVLRPAEA